MRVVVTSTDEYIFEYSKTLDEIKETFVDPNLSHAYRDASRVGGSRKIIKIEEYIPDLSPNEYLDLAMRNFEKSRSTKIYWEHEILNILKRINKEDENNQSIE